MSIETVRAQLAILEAGITTTSGSAIGRAYTQLPREAVNDADLPAFLNFVRDGTSDITNVGEDAYQFTRLYTMWLLVLPGQEGLTQGEAESRVEPWIPAVYTYFNARPKLSAVTDVKRANIVGDTGPRQLIWADVVYWGCEFRLSVTERLTRSYVGNE